MVTFSHRFLTLNSGRTNSLGIEHIHISIFNIIRLAESLFSQLVYISSDYRNDEVFRQVLISINACINAKQYCLIDKSYSIPYKFDYEID